MGHITLVSHSMGILEARLQSMLGEETKDDQPAGKTPDQMMFSYASSAQARGIHVIIAGAAHLPGMLCLRIDSLLSIVQMPRGVPVATVAINNAINAGLLAVRLLGISGIDLQARMAQYQELNRRDEVLVKDDKLEKGGWEDYVNS
ncbi:hypothetical protein C2S52_013601 [Perilla frutescens var. hirtella]|nr:hypothetical protein C2S52_013601 [Perilla frutescens var. hirtella]